ncbi:acyltransferase family protein [Cellulomonas sp. URHD0024]|uniref:acyltransferase family protein n=1 Tax=Cellulomonas sp. URHD0024 TaxID=1302620 RepID=UPI000418BB57|nr:acyltransferase family protein [Cellulomonas sp. URHD0024]
MTTTGRSITLERPSPVAAPAPVRMPHLRGLDGIRALAVTAVVIYHLGAPWMRGGFLGVDVFFVLSGFLITTLILDEVERTGRFSLRHFYARRARRLLPALGLLLLVMAGVGLVLRSEVGELRGDIVAALGYASNWWQVAADRSYFELVSRPPLLQHLWSLAVEEQFYLVFPLVALLAIRWGRARVGQLAALLAIASTVAMGVIAIRTSSPVPHDPSRVYFGTDTHSMGLLVGAAMASVWMPWRSWQRAGSWTHERGLSVRRFEAGVTDVVGCLALLAVVAAFVWVDEFSAALYRGGFLAFSVIAAILVGAVVDPAGLLGRQLGRQPLRWVGERSYGIYLWHWPVFVLTRPGVDVQASPWLATPVRVAVVLLLAELSYRYVELPIRRGALSRALFAVRWGGVRRRSAILVGALASVVVAVTTTVAVAFAQVPAASAVGNVLQPGVPAALHLAPSPVPTGAPATSAPDPTPGIYMSLTTPPRAVAPVPAPPPPPPPPPPAPPDPIGGASAFGDSVMLGAAAELNARGIGVDAAESRQFGVMVDLVLASRAAGTLGHTVIVHGGTNGPIDEATLRRLLDSTRDRRVYLVNVHVPRTWEAFNDEVLSRVAAQYPNVHVLDWSTLAAGNRPWLYSDDIHLRPGTGRDGYADWVLASIQP